MKRWKDYMAPRLNLYQVKPVVMYGVIGNLSTGAIYVTGKTYTIWVTLINTGTAIQVINTKVPNIYMRPVRVGRDPNDLAGMTQVLGIWSVYPDDGEAAGGVGYHRTQHEWPNGDAPFIKGEQFYPSLAHPVAGQPKVYIYPGVYKTATGVKVVETVTTVDLTSSVPSTAHKARYAMIVVDSTGAFVVRNGAEVTGYSSLADSDIPDPADGDNCCWAVKIYAGQTEFRKDGNNNDFKDLRFSGMNPGGTSGVIAHAPTHISTGSDPIDGAVAGGASGLMTGADKTKLDFEAQADWNATSGGAEILNKPTILDAQIIVTEDLTSQVTGATAHFDLGATATGLMLVYANLRQLPSAVTPDVDMGGFTLSYIPTVADSVIVDYPTLATNVMSYNGNPLIYNNEYMWSI